MDEHERVEIPDYLRGKMVGELTPEEQEKYLEKVDVDTIKPSKLGEGGSGGGPGGGAEPSFDGRDRHKVKRESVAAEPIPFRYN